MLDQDIEPVNQDIEQEAQQIHQNQKLEDQILGQEWFLQQKAKLKCFFAIPQVSVSETVCPSCNIHCLWLRLSVGFLAKFILTDTAYTHVHSCSHGMK